MPRAARVKGEFSVYHVIIRGNEQRNIYREDQDKTRFLETFGRMKKRYDFKIYGYCLMSNHAHIIIDVLANDISEIMKSVNVSYVKYFNSKYARSGHLFQDRFKSQLVKDDRYLLELSRYIHWNPVKAKIVSNPGDYRWSSYNFYIGKNIDYLDLVDTSLILGSLSEDRTIAVREYIDYARRTQHEAWRQEIAASIIDVKDEKSDNPVLNEQEIITRIEQVVSDSGLSAVDVLSKGTQFRQVRNKAIYDLYQNTDLSLTEIGNLFGGLTCSTISKLIRQQEGD